MTNPSIPTHPHAPQPIVVTATPAVANAGAYACHRYAEDFFDAFKALGLQRSKSPVPYYLLCHSIELSLKAFLRAQMVTRDDVKDKIGHDLLKVHKWALPRNLGRIITLTNVEEELLAQANEYYASKDLEYLSIFKAMTGFGGLPDLAQLESLASRLLEATRQTAMDAINSPGPVHV